MLQRGRELFEKQNSAVGRKQRVGARRALDFCYRFLQTLNRQRRAPTENLTSKVRGECPLVGATSDRGSFQSASAHVGQVERGLQALKLFAVIQNVVVATLSLKVEQFKQESHRAFRTRLR